MAHLGGESSAEIDAPLARVWEIVQDVLIAPQWQGGLIGMTALERDDAGRATLVQTESDIKVRTIKSVVRFSYVDGPRRLTWSQEKGELKAMDGWWTLEELPEGRTRATYGLDVDPGRVLGLLVRGPIETHVRAVLVGARPDELKALVEKG